MGAVVNIDITEKILNWASVGDHNDITRFPYLIKEFLIEHGYNKSDIDTFIQYNDYAESNISVNERWVYVQKLYDYLKKSYDILCVGDMFKCHMIYIIIRNLEISPNHQQS